MLSVEYSLYPMGAVFISYASQDTDAARRMCEALRAQGVEVWFDQNELRGGDAWDQKIRRQIKECELFVPLISANTQARLEGYYRLEWKLAVDRSHLMAEERAFLLPVVIDETPEAAAKVPDRFRDFQWTRLKLEETPAQFALRVQALLGGAGAVEPTRSRPGSVSGKPKGSLIWTTVVPVIGLLFGLSVAIWPLWSNSRSRGRAREALPAQKPAEPALSEARQLTRKAQALYEPWDGATREDFALAEELLKKAVALDPVDGEVWAAYALLTCGQIILGHDRSPARLELARTTSERAIKLAPTSLQARFAQAFFFRFNPATRASAEKIMGELVARSPEDRLLIRSLAAMLRGQQKWDEALALLERAIALPGGDPVAVYNKYLVLFGAQRFVEAEALLDEAIAKQPMPYFYRAKATLLTLNHGDLDRAAEMLAKVAPAYLLEDAGAYWASQVWLWRREPEKCVAVWQNVTRDFIETSEFNGPKAFIVGEALRLAGRPAAAAAEWRGALQLVEQRQAAQPSAIQWVYWKARLFAVLDRHPEAEEALRIFDQRTNAKGVNDNNLPIYLLLGRKVEVLDALEKSHARLAGLLSPVPLAQFTNNLRFNPEWDLLREEPRFAKLLTPAKP